MMNGKSPHYDVAMVVRNFFVGDTRVEKEAGLLAARGLRVVVFALSRADLPKRLSTRSYDVVRIQAPFEPQPNASKGRRPLFEYPESGRPSLPVQAYFYARSVPGFARHMARRIGYHLLTIRALVRARPRVVHCHDLNTLAPAYVAARRSGAKLVYDSHELWLDRNWPPGAPPKRRHRLKEKTLERTLIQEADRVITVSETIADVLAERYGIAKPTVLLNVAEETRPQRPRDLREKVDHDGPLLLYLGRIVFGRGLEQAIRALEYLPRAALVAMGTPADGFIEELEAVAREVGVSSRVFFLPPVPPGEVIDWAQSADVGLCTIEPRCLSYELCLPNKLFQCAFAGLPIVATTLPEMSRWFERYPLGATCRPYDPSDLARAVNDVLSGAVPAMSAEERESFRTQWSWEAEGKKLEALYRELGLL